MMTPVNHHMRLKVMMTSPIITVLYRYAIGELVVVQDMFKSSSIFN